MYPSRPSKYMYISLKKRFYSVPLLKQNGHFIAIDSIVLFPFVPFYRERQRFLTNRVIVEFLPVENESRGQNSLKVNELISSQFTQPNPH